MTNIFPRRFATCSLFWRLIIKSIIIHWAVLQLYTLISYFKSIPISSSYVLIEQSKANLRASTVKLLTRLNQSSNIHICSNERLTYITLNIRFQYYLHWRSWMLILIEQCISLISISNMHQLEISYRPKTGLSLFQGNDY